MNRIQQLYLELLKESSFNEFDGVLVYEDLVNNQHMWKSVIMNRFDLITLRDLKDNYNNVDTLWILVNPEYKEQLLELINDWCADEVDFIENQEAGQLLGCYGCISDNSLLRIWWD